MDDAYIHRALRKAGRADFDRSPFYLRVFALAEQMQRRPLPRPVIPASLRKAPKSYNLTTQCFAARVDQRHRHCMARAEKLTAAQSDIASHGGLNPACHDFPVYRDFATPQLKDP